MTFPEKWMIIPKNEADEKIVLDWLKETVNREYMPCLISTVTRDYFKYFYPGYSNIDGSPYVAKSNVEHCYTDLIPGYTEIDMSIFLIITELMKQGHIKYLHKEDKNNNEVEF